MGKDDELYCECSDDEVYKESGLPRGSLGSGSNWRPMVAPGVVSAYERIAASPDGVVPIRWICPGRRPPTPTSGGQHAGESDENSKNAPSGSGCGDDDDDDEMEKANADFDFEDESMSSTPMRKLHAGSKELKGSARKKTTSFNSVLSNMKRHQEMDAKTRADMMAQARQQQQQLAATANPQQQQLAATANPQQQQLAGTPNPQQQQLAGTPNPQQLAATASPNLVPAAQPGQQQPQQQPSQLQQQQPQPGGGQQQFTPQQITTPQQPQSIQQPPQTQPSTT